MITEQDVFNKVATHLLKQNARSVSCDDGCVYRGALIGTVILKCAVGCLIPDELYRPEMDGQTVKRILENFPELRSVPEFFFVDLLDKLQLIHDREEIELWGVKLRELAYDRHLKFPEGL